MKLQLPVWLRAPASRIYAGLAWLWWQIKRQLGPFVWPAGIALAAFALLRLVRWTLHYPAGRWVFVGIGIGVAGSRVVALWLDRRRYHGLRDLNDDLGEWAELAKRSQVPEEDQVYVKGRGGPLP